MLVAQWNHQTILYIFAGSKRIRFLVLNVNKSNHFSSIWNVVFFLWIICHIDCCPCCCNLIVEFCATHFQVSADVSRRINEMKKLSINLEIKKMNEAQICEELNLIFFNKSRELTCQYCSKLFLKFCLFQRPFTPFFIRSYKYYQNRRTIDVQLNVFNWCPMGGTIDLSIVQMVILKLIKRQITVGSCKFTLYCCSANLIL